MANRRMFSMDVIDTDRFLDLPLTSQALYFHLCMRADDDGFISSPKRIIRLVGCGEDDLNILITREYVIPFESGVVVVRDWLIQNNVQPTRKKRTRYKDHLEKLTIEDGVYKCPENCTKELFQKDSSKQAERLDLDTSTAATNHASNDRLRSETFNYQEITDAWNNSVKDLPQVVKLTDARKKAIRSIVKQYSVEDVKQAFNLVNASDFLTGRSGAWNGCGFDWVIKPANFIKVFEGNYKNGSSCGIPDNVKSGLDLVAKYQQENQEERKISGSSWEEVFND